LTLLDLTLFIRVCYFFSWLLVLPGQGSLQFQGYPFFTLAYMQEKFDPETMEKWKTYRFASHSPFVSLFILDPYISHRICGLAF
jgi:hypothetical protein